MALRVILPVTEADYTREPPYITLQIYYIYYHVFEISELPELHSPCVVKVKGIEYHLEVEQADYDPEFHEPYISVSPINLNETSLPPDKVRQLLIDCGWLLAFTYAGTPDELMEKTTRNLSSNLVATFRPNKSEE